MKVSFRYSFWFVLTRFHPANMYLFKINNRNTRKRCEICPKLAIKAPEQCLGQIVCFRTMCRSSRPEVFLKIWKNVQENTCVGAFVLIKLQASGMQQINVCWAVNCCLFQSKYYFMWFRYVSELDIARNLMR